MAAEIKKSQNFSDVAGVLLGTLGVQNLPEIPLSLTVCEINDIFHFPKIHDGG